MGQGERSKHEADGLYHACVEQFGSAMDRFASGYESDPGLRLDLVQDIHAALWLSLRTFDGRCSLRTWTYRVAHNIAASYVARRLRHKSREWVSLDAAESTTDAGQAEAAANHRLLLSQILALVQNLAPADRQLILLYLEGLDSREIAEITGLSVTNVTTKIHRTKGLLARQLVKERNANVDTTEPRTRDDAGLASPTGRRNPSPYAKATS